MTLVNLSFLTAEPITQCIKQSDAPTSSDFVFRTLTQKIKQHPFMKNLGKNKNKISLAEPKEEKLIKPKMFLKVIVWMEKISNETLEFSQETLEISIRALKLYLEMSQESPKQLQMIGCVCLHLASKINEKTIISVESYRGCCGNIFTKEDFEQKEAQVYEKIWNIMPSETFVNLSEFVESEFFNNIAENKKGLLKSVIKEISHDEEFLIQEPICVIINLWAEIVYTGEYIFSREKLLEEVKCRKFEY